MGRIRDRGHFGRVKAIADRAKSERARRDRGRGWPPLPPPPPGKHGHDHDGQDRDGDPTGLACATACGACAAGRFTGAEEYRPDRYFALIHAGHVDDYAALGWTVHHHLYGLSGTDVLCPHIDLDEENREP